MNLSVIQWSEVDGSTSRKPLSNNFYMYPPSVNFGALMLHFDYRWDVASGVDFQRSTQKQEAVKMWLAQYIAVDGEWVDWFIEH